MVLGMLAYGEVARAGMAISSDLAAVASAYWW